MIVRLTAVGTEGKKAYSGNILTVGLRLEIRGHKAA